MSVYSMTGYAHAQSGAAEGAARAAINVELRSVNGRFLDLSFRLPDELRSLEPALREMLGAAFRRGKIEMRLSTAREADTGCAADAGTAEPPEPARRLVRGWLAEARPLSVNEALQWCQRGGHRKLDEAALQAAREGVQGREARGREGARLTDAAGQAAAPASWRLPPSRCWPWCSASSSA